MTEGRVRDQAGIGGLRPRDRVTVGALLVRLRVAARSIDSQAFSSAVAAGLLLGGGLLSLALTALLPWTGPRYDWRLSVLAVVAGAVGFALPWSRWPARAQVAYPVFALVLIALGGVGREGAVTPHLALLPLPFVFAGFTQRPGTSLLLLPPAAAALAVAANGTWSQAMVGGLLLALPMSAVAGETISRMVARQRRAEERIGRLLHAVRVLARVDDERRGAEVVAALAAELLDADAVAVMLSDPGRPRRYLNRAWFGHPALSDATPLVVDTRIVDLRAGETRFIEDASGSPLLGTAAGSRVRSVALVPLPGSDSIVGVLVALWGTPRLTLSAPARQSAELLSQEAGRMFGRLRETALLARQAETDPLTDLANRRTYARALSTLRPGDAVVIVDLDHFKSVNDRFGHAAGDQALRDLARCLRRVSRQADCVARYGGEEFALILADARTEGARAALRRLRRSWAALGPVTTFSAGVAVHEEGSGPVATVERADLALYRAKEGGRDRDEFAPGRDELVLDHETTAEVVLG